MQLRLQATKLEEQAIRLAALCGEFDWNRLTVWRKNIYRKFILSMLTGCGMEVVLTDSLDAHDRDEWIEHVINCQPCYNMIPNGIRPHIANGVSDESRGSVDPQATT